VRLWPPSRMYGTELPPYIHFNEAAPEDSILEVAERRGNGRERLTSVGVTPEEFQRIERHLNARVSPGLFFPYITLFTAAGQVNVYPEPRQ
jgi:hypothetical protein